MTKKSASAKTGIPGIACASDASSEAAKRFSQLIDAHRPDREVSLGRMFNSDGLKTNGKVFAMLVRDELVVKLPEERVASLIASGVGRRFDPGHGRLMKQWVAIKPETGLDWIALSQEARTFVAIS